MPQATKECRVCGKVYTACNTTRHFDGSFHWREVACSPECGEEYLRRIMDSREEADPPKEENEMLDDVEEVQEEDPFVTFGIFDSDE